MSNSPDYINDKCLEAIRKLILNMTNTVLRDLVIKIHVQAVVLKSVEASGRIPQGVVERLVAQASHSKDIAEAVDKKLEILRQILKSVDRLDQFLAAASQLSNETNPQN